MFDETPALLYHYKKHGRVSLVPHILVFSDAHGFSAPVERALAANPGAEAVVFLGDGLRGFCSAFEEAGERSPLICVAGNCDGPFCGEPQTLTQRLLGELLFITHGHLFGVKRSLEPLGSAAAKSGCKAALFGHTHSPVVTVAAGVLLINPGSIGLSGSYCRLELLHGQLCPYLLTA